MMEGAGVAPEAPWSSDHARRRRPTLTRPETWARAAAATITAGAGCTDTRAGLQRGMAPLTHGK